VQDGKKIGREQKSCRPVRLCETKAKECLLEMPENEKEATDVYAKNWKFGTQQSL
jgi:hypothetical protein